MKIWLISIFVLAMGCGGGSIPSEVDQHPMPDQEALIKYNQNAVRQENQDIDDYAEQHGLKVSKTGRGLQYCLLRNVEGPNAVADQWATVNYRVELLNGDTAYATKSGEPESFLVEMDDVESGLHEAIQLMSPGDSAVVLIPSYRAHGLIGDQDRIPMRSSLVYHIGLLKLSDNKR
ncbi:MAG: FKBP-type peptidyl-prolyl cis-trans isomerase [Flavobacteriales bacterium]|nr:FKBP-type peptidyl-prolyl cis-trans isomerase [Flavobacteriales bacterium]MBK6944978.1 FKBP-type peptidyl-prolyl cis-trans isomerase [Flavobacteriales bacterium]MBK7239327.1 FKBP-type peptidyl-prolyl cis-trans isomerase [Flavobacteriales bacterium]MBK9535469.1 FKBP-type peptidyl-prolyl cis-trans isomerase [Flavobacteriales bacterium]MBP9139876.1 FKBP-type peptidyl-prolyl cis-trans isomerase [Flavobacteriales bacterium]